MSWYEHIDHVRQQISALHALSKFQIKDTSAYSGSTTGAVMLNLGLVLQLGWHGEMSMGRPLPDGSAAPSLGLLAS